MNFMSALMGFGGKFYGGATSNKSHQCRENRKRKFNEQKKQQRIARRRNRS